VVVTLPDSQTAQMTTNPGPSIVGVFGNFGPAIGGGTMIVAGSGFHPTTTVTIGGAAATITSSSGTVMFVVVPPGTAGTAVVDVSS
jgi:hypothetical protein